MPNVAPKHILKKAWEFNRTDRIKIANAYYIWIEFDGGKHIFEMVSNGVPQDTHLALSNDEITGYSRRNVFRIDAKYFSKTGQLRLARYGTVLSVDHLTPSDLKLVRWKSMWCRLFLALHHTPEGEYRQSLSAGGLSEFIEYYKHEIHNEYKRVFNEPRPLGRELNASRKDFDYPSSSALYKWIVRYREFEFSDKAFVPLYRTKCGNRNQLPAHVKSCLLEKVQDFASSTRPTIDRIMTDINGALQRMSEDAGEQTARQVSRNTVHRHIQKIDAFRRTLGRYGQDRATRQFAAIGLGVDVTSPLERVEIDDWTIDLHALLVKSGEYKRMDKSTRRKIPRVRCTVTIAIDVFSRCIVGLAVSPEEPSAAGAIACLYSVLSEKDERAEWANCHYNWPMAGRPETVVTDGGPVFKSAFREVLSRAYINYESPDVDPRKRGTNESLFRYFKKLCSYFAGRAFANSVEKGSYKAEESASVTVEELMSYIVRFIVDVYHNRKHRGLGFRTPYNVWAEHAPTKNLPDAVDVARIFGFTVTRRLDKHGVTYNRFSYNNQKLNTLFEKMGERAVTVRIFPFDLGQVFVLIPPQYIGSEGLDDDEYITVPCITDAPAGLTLEQVKAAWSAANRSAHAEGADGERVSLAALLEINEAGKWASRRRGGENDTVSDNDYQRARRRKGHLNDAAFNPTVSGAFARSQPLEGSVDADAGGADDDFGDVIAPHAGPSQLRKAKDRLSISSRLAKGKVRRSKTSGASSEGDEPTARPKPPKSSINSFDGDDW